jgi:hypothetical protein
MNEQAIELPPAAIEALARGSAVEAVKAIRDHARCSLRDAHAAMEAHVRAHPDLVALFDSQRSEAAKRVPTAEESAAAAAEAWSMWD